MDHIWVLYAIGGLLAAGLMDFNKKAVMERKYTSEEYLTATAFLFLCFFTIYALIFGEGGFSWTLLLQGGLYGIAQVGTPLGIMTAYKYADVSFSLVAVRLLASFILLLVGVYFIGDVISVGNVVGFFLGMGAIFLLSGWSPNKKHEIHTKGYLGIALAVISIVGGHTLLKYYVGEVNVPNFMAIQSAVCFMVYMIYLRIRRKHTDIRFARLVSVSKYSLVPLVLLPLFLLYLLPNLYTYGPLSLGYKVMSYSLFIPIVLSMIFYGEAVTRVRLIALALTVLSIFLFLV